MASDNGLSDYEMPQSGILKTHGSRWDGLSGIVGAAERLTL